MSDVTHPRIFVHIAAYRDPECQWTLRDLFEKARHPERVFVGLCWQFVPEEDDHCFAIPTPRPDQVREIRFHINETRGLGWARQHAQAFWRGEEYALQIDSHMRFVQDWDEAMLATLAACDSADPVLTVYPPHYLPPDQLAPPEPQSVQHIARFVPGGQLKFGMVYVPEGCAEAGRPLPTAACAGGFIFSSSRILRDVPSDPDIFFNGEEPNLAVRLWTHGFDLFSPPTPLVYHYYLRHDTARPWTDFVTWPERHQATLRRMRALVEPANSTPADVAALGRFGLGTQRSLAEYERFAGVNFAGRTIADFAREYPYVRRPGVDLALPAEDLLPEVGTTLFVLDDEGILFAQAKGDFYRFDPQATYVWCAREAGAGWSEIASELARDSSMTDARRYLADVTAHWLGHRLIRALDIPAPKLEPIALRPQIDPDAFDFRVRTYELLGVTVSVRYGDRQLEHWVHPVLAHLETEAPPDPRRMLTLIRINLHVFLLSDDECLHTGGQVAELAPQVKFHLSRLAVARQLHMLQLHAGAVAIDGVLVLLPAVRGSGKTLLTARLVAAGGAYFSDEAVLIERGTEMVRPVPISLCVKQDGAALLQPYYPTILELPEHNREDGLRVRYLPPPRERIAPGPLRPGLVVFPRHEPGASVSLRPLSPAQTFARLMAECVAMPEALTTDDAARLVRRAETWPGYELITGDLDQAADAVMALCRRHATAPGNAGDVKPERTEHAELTSTLERN